MKNKYNYEIFGNTKIENYERIITNFIECKEPMYKTQFLAKMHTSPEWFCKAIDSIKINNPSLYVKYEEALKRKAYQRFLNAGNKIEQLVYYVKNNINEDGTSPINVCTFYKFLPVDYLKHYIEDNLFLSEYNINFERRYNNLGKLKSLMDVFSPENAEMIIEFSKTIGFELSKLHDINKSHYLITKKTFVYSGLPLPIELTNSIFKYLTDNEIPIMVSTVNDILARYDECNFEFDEYKKVKVK